MGYVLVAVLVVLIVAAAVAFFARGAARRRATSQGEDPRAIAATDRETPLGDTSEHAEPDAADGRTPPSERAGAAPAVDGGEGEGRRSIP